MVADDAHMGMEDHAKVGKALKHFFGSEEGEVLVSGTGLGGLGRFSNSICSLVVCLPSNNSAGLLRI